MNCPCIVWREILACDERANNPERGVWGELTAQGIRPINRPPRTFLHKENAAGGASVADRHPQAWRSERARLGAAAGAQKAAHRRWHVDRGIVSPDCPYCSGHLK